MTPLDISSLTAALLARLRDDSRTREAAISRSETINEAPSSCPWIGVYRTGVQYPIRLLGTAAGFRGMVIDLLIVVQASSTEMT